MSVWQPFGATNEPGTCLWCGRKLRANYDWEHEENSYKRINRRKTGYGWEDSGLFCSMRCGYGFGRNMAHLGARLKPRKDHG